MSQYWQPDPTDLAETYQSAYEVITGEEFPVQPATHLQIAKLTLERFNANNASKVLPVPFLSQRYNNLRNDCGPACVAMIDGYFDGEPPTVARAAKLARQEPHKYTAIWQLRVALYALQVRSKYVRPLTPAVIRQAIDLNRPVIALIQYNYLPERVQAYPYNGWHYIVITGYTFSGGVLAGFYYNDPLHLKGDGAGLFVTVDELVSATAGDGIMNRPHQGIVCYE